MKYVYIIIIYLISCKNVSHIYILFSNVISFKYFIYHIYFLYVQLFFSMIAFFLSASMFFYWIFFKNSLHLPAVFLASASYGLRHFSPYILFILFLATTAQIAWLYVCSLAIFGSVLTVINENSSSSSYFYLGLNIFISIYIYIFHLFVNP